MRIKIVIFLLVGCAILCMDNRQTYKILRRRRRKTNKQLIMNARDKYCRPASGKTYLLTFEQRIKSWRWCNKNLADFFLTMPAPACAQKDICVTIKEIKAILKAKEKNGPTICTWKELKDFFEFVYAVDLNYP